MTKFTAWRPALTDSSWTDRWWDEARAVFHQCQTYVLISAEVSVPDGTLGMNQSLRSCALLGPA